VDDLESGINGLPSSFTITAHLNEDQLTVQLAEALLTGTDPFGVEENLAGIEQLLESLADRAVETAETFVQAGKSMARGYQEAVDSISAATDRAFDPFGTKGGESSGTGGGGGQSIFDSDDPRVKTYLGLDPTPSWSEYYDWKRSQMEAGWLTPTGQTTAGFYDQYHPGALSNAQSMLSDADVDVIAGAVEKGAREGSWEGSQTGSARGTKAGFMGWQIPPI
jgi:hypothetical protein